MNNSLYITFQKFNDKLAAEQLIEVLRLNNIECLLEDVSANFDVTFANNEIDKDFRVKLKKQDFEKASALLISLSEKDIEDVDPEHYLFDFSNQELIEVVGKQDEWSKFDFVLAKKILKERGVDFSEEHIESLKLNRIAELSKSEKISNVWIYLGYIFAIFGGVISIAFGWCLKNFRKSLPNGERVFSYTNSDRIHGERILILGIISFIFWIVIKFSNLVV